MRVFFDASVLVAAMLSSSGGSAKLLLYGQKGVLTCVTSQTVVEEMLSHKNKFKKTTGQIEEFITKSGLLVREEIQEDEESPYVQVIDADDAHLVAGAKLTKCAVLVSLDRKHVLAAKGKFDPLRIVSPKELLEQVEEDVEALSSPSYLKSIATARNERKRNKK